jgi:hypothetical protein
MRLCRRRLTGGPSRQEALFLRIDRPIGTRSASCDTELRNPRSTPELDEVPSKLQDPSILENWARVCRSMWTATVLFLILSCCPVPTSSIGTREHFLHPHSFRHRYPVAAVSRISITQKISARAIPGKRFPHLLHRPLLSGIRTADSLSEARIAGCERSL